MNESVRLLLAGVLLLSCSCNSSAGLLQGRLVYGHEVRTVRLCGESQVLWLQVTAAQHQSLLAESSSLTAAPYQELFVVFSGRVMSDFPGELARDYDGTVRLDDLVSLSLQVPETCR